MRLTLNAILVVGLLAAIACHAGRPIVNTGAPNVGGTIAGNVTAPGNVPLSGRKVTAINAATSARYDTTTSTTGGYSIRVPIGTYRIDVELRAGETATKRPDQTTINNGDTDASRNFEIAVTAR
jgi:hypothetical protein